MLGRKLESFVRRQTPDDKQTILILIFAIPYDNIFLLQNNHIIKLTFQNYLRFEIVSRKSIGGVIIKNILRKL